MNEMRRLINIVESALFEYKTDITVQQQGDKLKQVADKVEQNKNLTPVQIVQGLEKMDPPNFQGRVVLDGSKNYYSSRIGGKFAYKLRVS